MFRFSNCKTFCFLRSTANMCFTSLPSTLFAHDSQIMCFVASDIWAITLVGLWARSSAAIRETARSRFIDSRPPRTIANRASQDRETVDNSRRISDAFELLTHSGSMPYAVRLDRLIYIFRNIALSMHSANQADMVVTGTKGAIVTVSTVAMLRRAGSARRSHRLIAENLPIIGPTYAEE